MLLFWVALAVFVLTIILDVLARHYEWDLWEEIFSPLFTIVSFVFLVISVGIVFFEDTTIEEFTDEYSLVLKQIEEYDNDTDFELKYDLYSKCKSMDDTINTHKRLANSIWRGNAYSYEIGTFEPLCFWFNDKFNVSSDDNVSVD